MLFNTVAIAVFAGWIGTEIKFQPVVRFKIYDWVEVLNVAVTFFDASMTTVHIGDVPEHEPDHEAKVEPEAGEASRTTDVPEV